MFKKVPGPRTNPTLAGRAQANRRELNRFEIRLGVVHVTALIGIVAGSLVGAFLLGLFSGQELGHEVAMYETRRSVPTLMLAGETNTPELGEDLLSEVYAQLDDQAIDDTKDGDAFEAANTAPEVISGVKAIEQGITEPETKSVSKSLEDESVAEEEDENLVVAALRPEVAQAANARESGSRVDEEALVRILGRGTDPKGTSKTETRLKERTLGAVRSEATTVRPETEKKTQEASMPSEIAPPVVAKVNTPVEPAKPQATAAVDRAASREAFGSPYVRKVIPSGWYAQVAAPRELDDAHSLASNLKDSGFMVVIEKARVRGQEYFRVLAGPENSKEHADRLVKQLSRESYVQGEPFVKLLK